MSKETTKRQPNIFLFHGDDDLKVKKTVDHWKLAFVRKHGAYGITTLRADEEGERLPGTLEALMASASLFSSTRLVIIYDLFSQKADIQQAVGKLLEGIDKQTFLVFVERRTVKQALKLYKFLNAMESRGAARIQHFEVPSGNSIVSYISRLTASYAAKIESKAASELALRLGFELVSYQSRAGISDARPNMWRIDSEVRKLATYSGAQMISLEDVKELVPPKLSENAFGIVDAASQGKTSESIRQLNEIFATKGATATDVQSQALNMVGVLASQFRGILQLLDAEENGLDLGNTLGWNRYRISAVSRVAHRFKKSQAAGYLVELAKIDRQLKRSIAPAKLLLSRFIQSIA